MGRFGTHEVAFLGEAELRTNKAATGRVKDRLDLELLDEVQGVTTKHPPDPKRKKP